jgi:hypothetical protein
MEPDKSLTTLASANPSYNNYFTAKNRDGDGAEFSFDFYVVIVIKKQLEHNSSASRNLPRLTFIDIHSNSDDN